MAIDYCIKISRAKKLHFNQTLTPINWYKRFLCGVGERRVEAERLHAVVSLVLGPSDPVKNVA